MKWYYTQIGGHTHVRVFMNGALCGHISFRNEEFEKIRHGWDMECVDDLIAEFIDETPKKP